MTGLMNGVIYSLAVREGGKTSGANSQNSLKPESMYTKE